MRSGCIVGEGLGGRFGWMCVGLGFSGGLEGEAWP